MNREFSKQTPKFRFTMATPVLIFLISMISCTEDKFDQGLYLFNQMGEAMEQKRLEENVPGVSYAVFSDKEILFSDAKGYADIVKNIPLQPDHIMHWFSISKLLTGVAIMQLVEQGKIDLDKTVQTYIPDFLPDPPDASSCQANPTVRQMLTHSSGMDENIAQLNYISLAGEEQTPIYDMASTQFDAQLRSCPEKDIFYSNMNFLVLGYLIEAVSGTDFRSYVKTNIIDAMNMDAGYSYNDEFLDRAASGYMYKLDLFQVVCGLNDNLCTELPGDFDQIHEYNLDGSSYGGVIGSVKSCADFFIGLFDQKERALSNSSVQTMTSLQIEDPDAKWIDKAYGLVFNLTYLESKGCIGHGGGGPGFATQVFYYPDRKIGIVVFINCSLDQEPYDRVRLYFTDIFHQYYIDN